MEAGRNIALKVPSDQWESTVGFYRDVVGLDQIPVPHESSRAFKFGSMTLWVDRCPHLSQSEVWLELVTGSLEAAAGELAVPGVARRDDIEALPDGLRAFWIKSPAGIVHLVSEEGS